MSTNRVSEDDFGYGGKRYTLEEWIRNCESLDEENSSTSTEAQHQYQVIAMNNRWYNYSCWLMYIMAYLYGTVDVVRKAFIGYCIHDVIMEAKEVLFDKVDNYVNGTSH